MVISEQRRSTVLDDASLRRLGERLRGNIIRPGSPAYEVARGVLNAAIDRYPAVIVQAANAEDVAETVSFARSNDLPLSVKAGGHGVGGHAVVDAGVVIDLSLLKSVAVDTDKRVARADAGLRAGEYLRSVEPFGLVSPVGDSSKTGLGGLTLGGGYGFLSGKHGLVIDNLLAAEIVTAEGKIVRASEEEHSDLFWAIRGGGGNFGVATAYEFRLHPLTQVLGGMAIYPFALARDVLHVYREVTATAPDELTTYVGMATMPDGMSVVGLLVSYAGDIAEGERLIAPFRETVQPVADMISPMPYSTVSSLADPFAPGGLSLYERWDSVGSLTDETIDALIELASPGQSLGNTVIVKQLNGAASRVAPTATAFPHREAPYAILSLAQWSDPSETEANIAWTRTMLEAVRPQRTGAYINASLDNPVREVFGVNYDRLVEVKNIYDPTNMFHGNVNIRPTVANA